MPPTCLVRASWDCADPSAKCLLAGETPYRSSWASCGSGAERQMVHQMRASTFPCVC